MTYNPNSPTEYVYRHISEITKIVNKLSDNMPGSADEKDIIYDILNEFYEALRDHIQTMQKMNYITKRLQEEHEEEKND